MAGKKNTDKKSIFDDDDYTPQNDNNIEEADATFLDEDEKVVNNEEFGEKFSPLEGEVKKRDYAQNVGVQSVPEVDRVPEPSVSNLPPPPPNAPNQDSSPFMGGEPNPSGQSINTNPNPSQNPKRESVRQEPLNPDMGEMTPKESKEAATMLVDAILSAYKMVWGAAYSLVAVEESALIEMTMNDELSMDIKVPISETEEMSIREVYEIFNGQAKDALTVNLQDPDFIKVRDAMIREFTKRGWGISDMQYIVQHFAKDTITRAIATYQLKKSINNLTIQLKNNYSEVKKLREEMVKINTRVEKSNAEPIRKTEPMPKQQSDRDLIQDAKDFVESYTIKQDLESDVREVPHYEGEESISDIADEGGQIVPIDNN